MDQQKPSHLLAQIQISAVNAVACALAVNPESRSPVTYILWVPYLCPRTCLSGDGQLSDAYRRELRDVMAYVVRLEWLDNMLPGERIHLWVLTWDAVAGEFRGISSAHWGPAAQVRHSVCATGTSLEHCRPAHWCRSALHPRPVPRWFERLAVLASIQE